VGRAEQLSPVSLDRVRDWLGRTDRVTIRPILDPTRIPPVDRHDPPDPLREAVILRDGHCVFPGCPIDARACDLDHITPYITPYVDRYVDRYLDPTTADHPARPASPTSPACAGDITG
jgi:hypothetical protein